MMSSLTRREGKPLLLALLSLALTLPCMQASFGQSQIWEGAGRPKLELKEGAGEGPAWHPKLGLLFSGHGNIMRWTREGKLIVHREKGGTNGLLFDAQGRLLACEPVRRLVSRTEGDDAPQTLTKEFEGAAYNQPNDITVDSKGRIYFSDPKYGPRNDLRIKDADGKPVEGVYRIDLDGSVHRVITHEADRPNGLLVTPDDRWLFVADNNNNDRGGARKLWRFRLNDGDVDLKSRTLIFDWGDGRGPDGMALDQKGRLYVAGGLNTGERAPVETNRRLGGIYVFSAHGEFLDFVHIPRDEVTNCAFGGEDRKTLYITAGGTLWSIRTKTPGRLVWPN